MVDSYSLEMDPKRLRDAGWFYEGDASEITWLSQDEGQRTPLGVSVYNRAWELFQEIISLHLTSQKEVGVLDAWFELETNQKDPEKYVALFLQAGVDINQTNSDGFTLLMLAAYQQNLPLSQVLLNKGADVTKQAHRSQTALSLAVDNGPSVLPLIELLLESGSSLQNHYHEQGLLGKACRDQPSLVPTFLKFGADPNEVYRPSGVTPLSLLVLGKKYLERLSYEPWTPDLDRIYETAAQALLHHGALPSISFQDDTQTESTALLLNESLDHPIQTLSIVQLNNSLQDMIPTTAVQLKRVPKI